MAAASTLAHRCAREPFGSESNSSWSPSPPPKAKVAFSNASRQRKTLRIRACKATDERVIKDDEVAPTGEFEKHEGHPPRAGVSSRAAQRSARKEVERTTYLVAAIMSSLGISSLAAMSIYYRFSWQMEGGDVPILEMFGTFALSVGAAVGMEYWARWAHRALWHDSLWPMHESHHRPRDGPYELNDAFAIINAVPAIGLMAYGYFNKGLIPGLSFGAGLGITVFGMAYMFVHDGLVHRRFPVGPIANVPYLRRVAAAHQLHHSDKFDGVPYGLFLGPEVTVALLFSTIIMSNTWSGNIRPVIDRTGCIWGVMIWLPVMVSGARRSGMWLGRIAEGDPAKDEGLRANGRLIKRDNPKSLSSYT